MTPLGGGLTKAKGLSQVFAADRRFLNERIRTSISYVGMETAVIPGREASEQFERADEYSDLVGGSILSARRCFAPHSNYLESERKGPANWATRRAILRPA